MHHSQIKSEVRKLIAEGTVIPAHPLALDADRKLDAKHQRALTRYYLDAGAGGLAVGVHTTQFAIRDVGLYRPVLELAAETAAAWTKRPLAMVAGLAGPTQAGHRGGEDRCRHRLSRRAAQPRRDEIGFRRRHHRALPSGGARDSAGRVLSAAGGRRRHPRRQFLAALCRRSTMSSPSRSRRSTAIERWTCCAASPRPARSIESRSIPATTITSCSI